MLYHIYETQRSLMEPFTDFAQAAAKLFSNPLSPFSETPLAQRMSDRAVKVIQATEAGELLPRVASEPSFYECKYCAWARRCWREQGVNASGVQS